MSPLVSPDLKTLDNFLEILSLETRSSDAPIVVVGCGRSGTSAVAKRLHEVGVFLGDKFRDPDPFNPEGYFEDLEIVAVNTLVERGLSDIPHWQSSMRVVTDKRRDAHRLWGWKDPRTAFVLREVMEMFPKATFVRTRRNKEAVIKSLRRCMGFNQRQAESVWSRYEGNLDAHLNGAHVIEVEIGDRPHTGTTMKATKVRMAVPTGGRVHVGVMHAFLAMSADPRYDKELQSAIAKPYDSNLNQIVAAFLQSDADYLLTMDDDNPPEHNPLDLVELDKDIIGLPTPMLVQGVPMWNTFEMTGEHRFKPMSHASGLHRVGAIGSGCLLVARRVYAHPDLKAPFLAKYDEEGVRAGGADLIFCERAQKAGFEVWAHYDYKCEHFKELGLRRYCP